jgi:hypothetical protein
MTSRLPAAAILAACIVCGCAPDASIEESTAPSSPTALATDRAARADPTAVAEAAAFGTWRPAPAYPTPDLQTRSEAACREDEVVGSKPLAVLDVRGEGLVTLVFVDADGAALCRVAMDGPDGEARAVVRPVAGSADAAAPGDEELGVHDLEVTDETTIPRVVLVGAVGDAAMGVSINHDDATWTKASMDNGWYAVWWPLAKEAIGVAAVDRRGIVMTSYAP